MPIADTNLIWIDLEMSGLDPAKERIIEIATVVTDAHLNVLAEGPVMAIHQADELLDAMDKWNTKHHGESGLTQRVRESKISEEEAMAKTLTFLKQYVPEGKSPMCGNSVWQDRRFLLKYMPALESYFHYRHVDVSTLKELMLRWRPDLKEGFKKDTKHLALADIHESIDELKYYRQHFLIAEKPE